MPGKWVNDWLGCSIAAVKYWYSTASETQKFPRQPKAKLGPISLQGAIVT